VKSEVAMGTRKQSQGQCWAQIGEAPKSEAAPGSRVGG
jgi:hypothetical protein